MDEACRLTRGQKGTGDFDLARRSDAVKQDLDERAGVVVAIDFFYLVKQRIGRCSHRTSKTLSGTNWHNCDLTTGRG